MRRRIHTTYIHVHSSVHVRIYTQHSRPYMCAYLYTTLSTSVTRLDDLYKILVINFRSKVVQI